MTVKLYQSIQAVLYALILRDIGVRDLTSNVASKEPFGMVDLLFIIICRKCLVSLIYEGVA